MRREEMLTAIRGFDYTTHGGSYITMDHEDFCHVSDVIPCGYWSQNDTGKVLISLDAEFIDEADLCSALAFCGLYAGQ